MKSAHHGSNNSNSTEWLAELKPELTIISAGKNKIGYVANSPHTVKGDCMSAGRLYDKIGKKSKGKVLMVLPYGAVCKIKETK